MRRSAFAIIAGLVTFALVMEALIWALPWQWNPHWQSREMWLATPFMFAVAAVIAAYVTATLAPRWPYAHGLIVALLPFIRAYDGLDEPVWWVSSLAGLGIDAVLLGILLAGRHRRSMSVRRAHN